jgi:hypothetical protein
VKRVTGLALVLASLISPAVIRAQEDPAAELQASIALVNDGDFESALPRLDAAIPKVPLPDRAQAYVYRGAAYVGLGQEHEARASFKEALRYNATLRLAADKFPPRVIRVFEAVRSGKGRSALYARGALGVAGAASAVALAAGATAGASKILESKPTPVPPLSVDFAFLGSDPPAGSTISMSGRTMTSMTLGVTANRDIEVHFDGRLPPPSSTTGLCISLSQNAGVNSSLKAGQPLVVSLPASYFLDPTCLIPQELTAISVTVSEVVGPNRALTPRGTYLIVVRYTLVE